MKKKLTIEIHGDDDRDLELALGEITRYIREGYLGGGDSNDTGRYSYKVVDEE